MPQRRAGHGQSCAHVAAGHLDHRHARLEAPIRARRQQDGLGGAVLHAAAGLQELGLGDQPAGPAWIRSNEIRGVFPIKSSAEVASMSVPVHGRRGGPASRTEIVGNASAGVSLAAQRRPPPLRSAPPPPRPAWAADPARPGSRAAAPRRMRPAAPCSRPDCATPTQSPAARAWPQLIGHVARARRPASPPGGRRRRNP